MSDNKPKGVGISLRGFGDALIKLVKPKKSGPGLSDYYYKGTKKRPTLLSKYYKSKGGMVKK
jgi:hypothetical protein